MPYFRFSGFSGFPDPETGNPVLLLSGAHPGTKTDPTVPHMWAKGQSCPRFFVRLAKCNIDERNLQVFLDFFDSFETTALIFWLI